MKEIKRLFPFILLIAVTTLFVTVLLPDWTSNTVTPSTTPISQTVNEDEVIVTEIDFGEGEPISITLEEEQHTALSALQKAIEIIEFDLETQQYDFGIFIKSINGYESTAEKSWIYFVNDQAGTVAADQMQLKRGDTVSWRYIVPTQE